MKKMFSCSTHQVAVESWNKYDQKLFDAVEKGDVTRTSLLASRKTAKPTKFNAMGQSAFHLAASKGLTECLTILLTHGAGANVRNDDGSTALHLATIACQPQCVKVLLQHGANEDCVDGGNRTPLHWAAFSGCASSVLLLCDQEAFLDVRDNHGRTPLMIAAQGNQTAICSQLLQRGAKVDLVDKDGKSALILASESGSTESATLLLQSGANMVLVDSTGHDSLYYAVQSKNRSLRRSIQAALKKWKKKELGIVDSSETGSQVPSESGRETDVSSVAFQSEKGEQSDDEAEAEEDPELQEWRSRFREEKMKVIQLELRLDQKMKECRSLSEGSKGLKERVREQVWEIHQHLLGGTGSCQEGKEQGQRYSHRAPEDQDCLKLLAEQVQELKERRKRQETEKELPKAGDVKQEPEKLRWPGEEEEEEEKQRQLELKRLRSEVAAALEEKASAAKRVQEMEGHMENLRAVIRVFEAKKKTQNATLKDMELCVQELDDENQRLRGLLAKQLAGRLESGPAQEEVVRVVKEMEEIQARAREETATVVAENEVLKQDAEEAVRSRLQFQAVPSGAVKKCVSAWKKVVAGLEGALAKLEQVNVTLLEKARPLQESILASPPRGVINGNGLPEEKNQGSGDESGCTKALEQLQRLGAEKTKLQNGTVGLVTLGPKQIWMENKARPCLKSSGLEKEVWDLKQNNGGLIKELAQLSREREKLQGELLKLSCSTEGSPQSEETGRLVDELERTVDSLSQQLSAEKEESGRLRLKLEEQSREMAFVRDNFLKKMSQEAASLAGENLDSCILKELHWKLDNVVRKQNEALQLVSEMEEENHALQVDRTLLVDAQSLSFLPGDAKAQREISLEASEVIGENRRVREQMVDLEKGLRELKVALDASQALPGSRCHKAVSPMQLLHRLLAQVAELRQQEEKVLGKYEKICGLLSSRAQALAEELASLREKYEEMRGASAHLVEALHSERRKTQELMTEALEQEEEVDELRGKSQQLETAVEKLSKKVDEMSVVCQDREGKIKKLLKETEKLSSEVLNLRSERARLILQNEVSQKNHQEIVAIYRTHLLNAAQGYMDEEVHEMLLRILRTA